MLPTLEMQNLAYSLLNVLGGILLLIFNLTQFNKKKSFLSNGAKACVNYFSENKEKNKFFGFLSNFNVWVVIEIFLISVFQFVPAATLNFNFGHLMRTEANYFGLLFFIPFILLLVCLALRVDPIKQIDLITPAFPFALISVKMGCFCAGCCRGYVWSGGLYNYKTGYTEIPLQLLETGLALVIFIFLLLWRKKAKPGTMFPTYMIVYSVTRFFSEFFSHKENIVGPFNVYQILCVAGVIIGFIELLLILEYSKKLQQFFTETPYGYFVNAIKEKAKEKPKKEKTKKAKR